MEDNTTSGSYVIKTEKARLLVCVIIENNVLQTEKFFSWNVFIFMNIVVF
jgi:hypothetical protein